MRAMVIGPEDKARAKELLAFAAKPENWYRPPFTKRTAPGIDERYVMLIEDGYRVVFSYTCPEGQKVYKHLSISIDSSTLYPHPIAVEMIAALFEFTGASVDNPDFAIFQNVGKVMTKVNEDEHCIVLAEEVTLATLTN
jgi:hypothetical protein